MENTQTVATEEELPYCTVEEFLKYIERRAFHMARTGTGSTDSAMDIVQDSMYKLVEKYSSKQPSEWKPLFYRILNSRLTDYYRRKAVRDRVFIWSKSAPKDSEDSVAGPVDRAVGRQSETPDEMLMRGQRIQQLNHSVQQLPYRQRQAFMLRCWEGLSTIETASAMEISQGSVKTHYSRAMHALRDMLEDYRRD
ncbi:RNA polymerase sigma factor [Porticoccaceae bacterium]|jgi:RNA polymerase sigma-70 factor (ECF subfamily)|nr:RNA polymerase sigma factor [Porticoccaceae bacterium]MDB3967090.1 RNA polymerase sigma factor [Porticoccaceae bacterium]